MEHEQQLSVILSGNTAAFESLLSDLTSPTNHLRSRAESLLQTLHDHHPSPLVLHLASLLPSSPHRDLAAILLRHQLRLFPLLPASTQSVFKSSLLTSLQFETSKSVSTKLIDTISELAAYILRCNAWPELLPFAFKSANSDIPRLREASLLIFSRLLRFAPQTLTEHLPHLHAVILNSLLASPDVRLAALSSAVNLVKSVSFEQFQDLLPPMMRTLTDLLNLNLESVAQEALKQLIELAGAEPKFFRPMLADVLQTMMQVAEADRLEEGIRHLALEFFVTLAEAREQAPGMMTAVPEFLRRVFTVLMGMLLFLEDDPEWYRSEDENQEVGLTSAYRVGEECSDRLSIALGGCTILPVAFELLPMYLAAPEWQKRHAAFVVLAQIAEGCSEVMAKNLEQLVSMVLTSFHDPHPRVRWAAINAIAQMSADLGPQLQLGYHQQVLPALAYAIDDVQNPRVQAHAAAAVIYFVENGSADVLVSYFDVLVSKLAILLKNKNKMVLEGALPALASLANAAQEHFQKYYDLVMPYLKSVLVNTTDKSYKTLCAKSMECISLVGQAAGKEKFRNDAKEVMEVILALQGPQLESDDMMMDHMLHAWARICNCIGKDFLQYMGAVMPPLLRSVQLMPHVTVASADSDTVMDDSGDERAVLDKKATACYTISCCAHELKEGFFPWIDQVVPVLVPLLKCYYHSGMRKVAVSAMPALLNSAKLAVDGGLAQGREISYVKNLSDYIIPALVEALHEEPDIDICASMLESLNSSMKISGQLLENGQVKLIVDEIKNVIIASATRKKERMDRAKHEDFDAEEGEFLKEENELEEAIFGLIGECLGTLIETFKASFLPFFDEIHTYITPMWGKDNTVDERRIAIFVFIDVAEECKESATKYYGIYFPLLLEACNDENPDVRQAAVYGLGVCAEFGGPVFRPLVGGALSRLENMIRHPEAKLPENIMAYDNAVSTLGKICKFHRDVINAAQVIPAWLSCLPIKDDIEEAKNVHEQLCSMVKRSDGDLLGPNNQNVPKLVAVFGEVICARNLVTVQTAKQMFLILRQLRQTLPRAIFASALSSLDPQQQIALESALSRASS